MLGGGGWWGVQSSAKFCDKKDVFDEMIMIAYSLVAEIVPLVEICKRDLKFICFFVHPLKNWWYHYHRLSLPS